MAFRTEDTHDNQAARPSSKGWSWWNASPETTNRLSILATGETALAMAIAIFLGFHFNLWVYLFLACFVAPAFLLRTDKSRSLGIRFYLIAVIWARKHVPSPQNTSQATINPRRRAIYMLWQMTSILWLLMAHFIYYLFVLIASLVIKVSVTLYCSVRHPLQSVSAIPSNWTTACFFTDFATPLELVPGIRVFPHGPLFRTDKWVRHRPMTLCNLLVLLDRTLSTEDNVRPRPLPNQAQVKKDVYDAVLDPLTDYFEIYVFRQRNVLLFAILGVLIVTHLVAWWYRWSVKTTAIVWLPLLYITSDIAPRMWTVERRLESICTSAASRLARGYALIMGMLLTAKFVVQIVWYKGVRALVESNDLIKTLVPLIEPIDVPIWQLLSVVNAIGAWALYLWADWQLRKRRYNEGLSDKSVYQCLSLAIALRWGVSIYTSICSLYAIYIIVKNSRPPEWSLRFFPWQ